MTWPTDGGTPRWRSPQARIEGPSLSRKNSESAVMARKNTRPESALRPSASPLSRCETAALTESLPSFFAFSAPDELTPASLSQLASVSLASERWPSMLVSSPVMPVEDQDEQTDADGDDAEQHEGGAQAARKATPLEPADDRRRHGRDDRGGDDRGDDHLGQRHEPDRTDKEQRHADQQPGGESDVAQP